MESKDTPQKLLLKYWGYSSFREKQEEIIDSVLAGADTLALLPTGGGKSVCFQIPALLNDGICLVISPLIALMQDQVQNLKSKGIKAIAITSAMSKREIDIALDNAVYGNFKFLYVSPERLETDLFKARLKKMTVNLVAIDEAHCISQWGYDFRPSYLNIVKLKEGLTEVSFLALTATATKKVAADIQEKLEFKEINLIQKSFERRNLAYVVLKEEAQLRRMLKVIDGVKGSGLVYVSSRKKTKEVASFLRNHKLSAEYYHAGLTHEQRREKQTEWIENRCQIMVATNAFGMGIDKPNVRFVIHLDLPESLEAYFQEAGRAGRDGKKAYAVLLLEPSMTADLRKKVELAYPPKEGIKQIYLALGNYFQIAIGCGEGQVFSLDLPEFSKRYKFNLVECYHSLKFLMKEQLIHLSEGFSEQSKVNILLTQEDLYRFQVANKKYDHFIKTLLRTYGGLFDDYMKIKEYDLATNLKTSKEQVVKTLKRLKTLEVVDYQEQNNSPQLTYLQPRLEQNAVRISKENYADRKRIAVEKLDEVIHYVETSHFCRSQMLLRYFGEENTLRCGICDFCLERNKLELNDIEFKEIEEQILKTIESKSLSSQQITAKVERYKEGKTLKVLSFLTDNNKIQTDGRKFFIVSQ